MNYQKIYDSLITNRQLNPLPQDTYTEKHHIKPRCMGGDNSRGNLVNLTGREHFLAHWLLAKIYGGRLWAALKVMCVKNSKSGKGKKLTSRSYQKIREMDSLWRSEWYKGENNPNYRKSPSIDALRKMRGPRPSISGENNHRHGVKMLESTKDIISHIRAYHPSKVDIDLTVMCRINELAGVSKVKTLDKRDCLRPEILKLKRQIIFQHKGQRHKSGELNPNYGNGDKIRGEKNPMYGKAQKDSTKAKIAEKAKRKIECPHCKKVGSISNMKRWHFDNCKALSL